VEANNRATYFCHELSDETNKLIKKYGLCDSRITIMVVGEKLKSINISYSPLKKNKKIQKNG